MIARTLQSRLPNGVAVDEIVVTGGGQHNGMLLHEIGRLTKVPLLRPDELGHPTDSLDAATAALLALLHLDQVPANPTSITKAATPRLLGRLTGGSPRSWQLLLETCRRRQCGAPPVAGGGVAVRGERKEESGERRANPPESHLQLGPLALWERVRVKATLHCYNLVPSPPGEG